MPNRLAHSRSPYLRQHADNPVDWWEWGPEAFAEARRRDVPIFLSVGYASCHWCHVMAHESFSDPQVARLLNDSFVSIKVDREERPDVDAIYMDVTLGLTGHGGWPMSVFLTPSGHAFYAGTYFPPSPQPSIPSFTQVLTALGTQWREHRDELHDSGIAITRALTAQQQPTPATLTPDDVEHAVRDLADHADHLGGFGTAPKFPPSTVLDALLARATAADESGGACWNVAATTLEHMARGGIYDQLAGGFARYATDRAWVVPHFEKMLYDNALLLRPYARAAVHADGDRAALMRRVVVESVEWLCADLRTEAGGFASSLDADSLAPSTGEPREGAYYTWSPEDLVEVLGEADGDRAGAVLAVGVPGTFERRTSTLQLLTDPDDPAWFATTRRRLRDARSQRPKPPRDDKLIAAWNGWLIASLAESAMLLDRPDWVQIAERAADAVLEIHLDGDRLRRASLDGAASAAPGVAEDYAAMALGLLVLAAVSGRSDHLAQGLHLLEVLQTEFVAPDGGVIDATAADLVRRPRTVAESATPSATTATLRAARTAYRLTADHRWYRWAEDLLATAAPVITRAPRASGWALADAVAEHGPRLPVEVAIVGEPTGGPLSRLAWRLAPPGSVVVTGEPDSGIPLLDHRPAVGGRPTAYVCRGHVCDRPVTSASDLSELLA